MAIVKFLLGVVLWSLGMVLGSWFICSVCDAGPQLGEEYGFFSGIWHGMFSVGSIIRSWFVDGVVTKAEYYTSGYNVMWWLGTIGTWVNIFVQGVKMIFTF